MNRFSLVTLGFIGTIGFANAQASAGDIASEIAESRAADAALWGMPAVK